jgi:hypothetical protein
MSKVTVIFTVEKAGFKEGDTKAISKNLADELVKKGYAKYSEGESIAEAPVSKPKGRKPKA